MTNQFKKQNQAPEPQNQNQEQIQEMLEQEVENLQNNGVFRLKLLGAIERQTKVMAEQNKTISDFAEALFEKLDSMIVPTEQQEELPKEDEFELPPLPKKK